MNYFDSVDEFCTVAAVPVVGIVVMVAVVDVDAIAAHVVVFVVQVQNDVLNTGFSK